MAPKKNQQSNTNSNNSAAASSGNKDTTSEQQQQPIRPPTGKIETITPTMPQLLNLNHQHIRDDDAKETLKKLQDVRNAQNKNRDELRALIDKQQQANRGGDGKSSSSSSSSKLQLDALDSEFKKLQVEKSAASTKMDVLRLDQANLSRNSDRVKLVDAEFDIAVRDARPARDKLADLKKKLQDTQDEVEQNKSVEFGGFSSASSVEEELMKIAKQIEDATQKNDQKLVAVLGKTQSNLMKAKRGFLKVFELEDSLSSISKQVDKQQKIVDAINKKVDDLDKERSDLRESIKSAPSFGAEFDKCRGQLSKINNQLDANREKKRNITKQADKERQNPEYEARSKEIDDKRKTQDDLSADLDKLKAQVTFKRIEYDTELRGDLIGRRGATIGQFQQDFGVYVDFDSQGWAMVVGGEDDVDAAMEGIKQMCATLRNSRQNEVIKFDPLQSPQIIGTGGSNIRRFETLSGASIKIDSAAGTATITGTPENIATARNLFEDHFKNNAEVAIPFRKDLLNDILGRGGATVRKIEQDSSCRRIRVDKDNFVVYCYGNQENCDKAKAAYQKILAELSTPPFTMKIDDKQIRIIIGKAGATINELQKTSGAKIDINQPAKGQKFGTLLARGNKESIDSLKVALDDLLVREEVKLAVPSALYGLLVDTKNTENDDGVCVLERVKKSSNADQVSLIRSEGVVVIRGKRDQVSTARQSLERFMLQNRVDSTKITFNAAIFGKLTDRSKGTNLLDSALNKAKESGNNNGENDDDDNNNNSAVFLNAEINKKDGIIEINGLDKNQVQLATLELKKVLDELNKSTRSMVVAQSAVPAIVGQGGATIRDLQTKFKAEININRDKSEVSVYCTDAEDLQGCCEAIEQLAAKN